MNKKKLLALLMALVMTFSLVPVTALAETEQPANVAMIGEAGYPSLADAVAAADDGATITLVADDTSSLTNGGEIVIDKSLTITGATNDSGEPLYTIFGTPGTTGTNVIFISGSGTVTLSNLKIQGFGCDAGTDPGHAPVYVSTGFTGTVNFTNLYISDFNRGGMFLYGGNFSVVDCDINCANSHSGAFTKGIEIKGGASGTISDTVIYNMERSGNDSTAGIEIYGSGTVVVDGCTILSDVGEHKAVKATYGIVSSRVGVHDPSGGSLVVNNTSTFTTNAAVSVADSDEYGPVNNYSITVNECDFDNYIATWSATSSITINSGNFAKDVYADAGTINIQGGEFTNFAPDTGTTGSISITGGTFDADPTKYVAEDYKAVDNDDDTWTVQAKDYVAQIDDDKYETLADAVSNATAGQTITLLSDIALTETVSIDKNLTIDLAGNDITATDRRALWIKTGYVTLEGTGTISSVATVGSSFSKDSSVIRVGSTETTHQPFATLDLGTGVTVSTDHCYGITIFGDNVKNSAGYGQVLICKGNVTAKDRPAISGNGTSTLASTNISINEGATVSATNEYAIYHPQAGKLTVKGTVSGQGGVEMKAGTLALEASGVITASGTATHPGVNNNGTSTSGYAIALVENSGYKGGATAKISKGTIDGTIGKIVDSEVESAKKATLSVSGGSFNSAVPVEYCAPGYEPSGADITGRYTVQVTSASGVASITRGDVTTYYLTVSAALSAAQEGETVVLEKDQNLSGIFNRFTLDNQDNFTLDLGGNTLKMNGAHFTLNGANLTVTNGRIETEGNFSQEFTVNSGTLTIEESATVIGTGKISPIGIFGPATVNTSGTLTAENSFAIAGNGSNGKGGYTINVTGGTVSSTGASAIYHPNNGTLNVSGGTITGTTGIYQKSGTMNITGGTITGNGAAAGYTYNGNGANATGDAIVIDNCNYPGGKPTANIKGATLASTNGKQVGYYESEPDEEATVLADKAYTLSTNVPAKGWVATGEETYRAKIDNLTPVAEVNSNQYNTLEAAVAAANSGDTITLLADIDLAVDPLTDGGYAAVAPADKEITLDLNENDISGGALDVYGTLTITGSGTITGSKHGIYVNEGGVLNVQGGTITTTGAGYPVIANPGTVTISGGAVTNATGGCAVYVIDGTLDITGGTVTSTKDDTEAVAVAGTTVATISGGTVTGHDWGVTAFGTSSLTVSGDAVISATDGIGISTNGNAGQNPSVTVSGGTVTGTGIGIYQPSGTLVVSGGTITGATGVYFKSNSLNISGGTIIGNGTAKEYNYNGNGANATGDALVIDSCGYPNGINDVSVSGGSFQSTNAKAVACYTYQQNTPVTGFITGGKYSSEPDSSYVADGYKAASIENDTYHYQVGVVDVKPTTSGSINDGSVTFNVTTTVKEHKDSESSLESYDNLSVTVNGTSDEVVDLGNAATAAAALTNIQDDDTLKKIVSSAIEAAGTKITDETHQANVTIQLAKSAADTDTDSGKVTYEVHPEAIISVDNVNVGTVKLTNNQIKGEFRFKLYAKNIDGVDTGDQILVTHTHDDGNLDELGPFTVDEAGYIEVTGVTEFSEFTLEEFTEVTASATYGYTISLEDSINIVLNVKNLTGNPADYTVTYTFKGVEKTVRLTENDLNRITVASCAAKEMGEVVYVSVKYNNAEIKAFDLSIRGYCEQAISSSKNTRAVALCKAVLDYGRYAQEAFNYKPGNLVNDGIDNFTNANIAIPAPSYTFGGDKPSGITGVSATLITTSETQLVVYFKYDQGVDPSRYTIKVGDEVVDWSKLTTESSKIKVVVTGIAAKNLAEKKAVSISYGTDTYTIHISPVDYMGVARNGSQAALNRAFYNYYLKADAYFKNK